MKYYIKLIIVNTLGFFLFIEGYSQDLDPFIAAKFAKENHLKSPQPDPDGRVQTLNKKGAMSPYFDEISKLFIEFAAQPDRKVLEIGAGYGLACIQALKAGAKDYTANDLDERHLKILALDIQSIDPIFLSYLHLNVGDIAKDFKIKENRFDAILIARVLHFMDPQKLNKALQAIYKILKPGGKIYAVMLSPYVKGYLSFIPEFEKRVRENSPNPGYIENLLEYADSALIPQEALSNTENKFFFFDTRTAAETFENNGFIIEKNIEMPLAYPSRIWSLDGRENIGVIAKKPI